MARLLRFGSQNPPAMGRVQSHALTASKAGTLKSWCIYFDRSQSKTPTSDNEAEMKQMTIT